MIVNRFQNRFRRSCLKEDFERYFQAVSSHDMMRKMLDAMAKPIHQMAHAQGAKDKD